MIRSDKNPSSELQRAGQRPAAQRQAEEAGRGAAADDRLAAGSPRLQAQRQGLQSAFGGAAQLREDAPPVNRTGLPDGLKSGIENLSGMDMSGVRVHANSGEPARLDALAYAQGDDIHVAPGQEQHLPHEAWHVVQQRQGRVQPTAQLAGTAVNDDPALEAEADSMGARALQRQAAGEEDLVQRQAGPEEELAQRQAAPEDELLQRQAAPEEELLQRQAAPEDELLQRQAATEEEPLQRQAAPEEELAQRRPSSS